MQNSDTEAVSEARFIPRRLYAAGLLCCFIHQGNSMLPAFRPGHLLYVRPIVRDIVPGDVIVFASREGGYITHRVVAITDVGLITRGDNNPCNDQYPIPLERVVGRVEIIEDQARFKPVAKGKIGLWSMRVERHARRALNRLFTSFEPLYWKLCYSPKLRWLLRQLAGRRLKVLRLHSARGPWLKVLLGRRVIARWQPGQPGPTVRKPYDLLVLREHIPNPEEPSCIKRET